MSKLINNIEVTKSAESYLKKLIDAKNESDLGIRLFVDKPGTPKAETCLAFCNLAETSSDDLHIQLKLIDLFIEKRSLDFLTDAHINFDQDNFDGQLTIKAPHARLPNIKDDSPIEDKINYILYNEINPMLASHGGEVSLIEFNDKSEVILQFGGGCQGCGMIDVTLKDGIEKTLVDQLPEITAVKDITDHSQNENAFYSD